MCKDSLLAAGDPTVFKVDPKPCFQDTFNLTHHPFCSITYLTFLIDCTQQITSHSHTVLHRFYGLVGENLESRKERQTHPCRILLLQLPESLLGVDPSLVSLESSAQTPTFSQNGRQDGDANGTTNNNWDDSKQGRRGWFPLPLPPAPFSQTSDTEVSLVDSVLGPALKNKKDLNLKPWASFLTSQGLYTHPFGDNKTHLQGECHD